MTSRSQNHMQITIEVLDTKAGFVLELLKSLPFVDVQSFQPNAGDEAPGSIGQFSPKTARLLGSFPQLGTHDDGHVRQEAIQAKHVR